MISLQSAARLRAVLLQARCYSTTLPTASGNTIYRRLNSFTNHDRIPTSPCCVIPTARSPHSFYPPSLRSFSTTLRNPAVSFRDLKSEDAAKENPQQKEEATTEEPELDPAEIAYRQATRKSRERERQEWERLKAQEEQETAEKDGKGGEQNQKERQEQKKTEDAPPPPHGSKSPLQVFTETLRTEFKASKEWNDSMKSIASSANSFTQNENFKKAKASYDATSRVASSSTASAFKSTGKALGQSAAWTWESAPIRGLREGASIAARGIDKATKPIRETEAFKSVQDTIDDGSSSRYGGWVEKEERRKRRERREQRETAPGSQRPEKVEEDPNAGTRVTLHKDSLLHTKWKEFRDNNPMMQSLFSLRSSYQQSENPVVSTARSISDRIAGFFSENESALVIKKFREMDPTFSIEPFLRDMREYILPEVLDAYVKGDLDTLQMWLSAPQFQVYQALAKQYLQAGLKSAGKILDIRNVDILSARILQPGDIPIFVVTCRTQEVHVYRNAKTDELAAGTEDKIQQVTYAIGIGRSPEDVNNPDTRGWRLIELQKSARDYI